jgi:ribonuclease HI
VAVFQIYTDGGCSGNPGPGGWAFVIRQNHERTTGFGAEKQTTNNKMELTAVIKALEAVHGIAGTVNPGALSIQIYTDSQYVKNGITDWIFKWERNGWKTSGKEPVKNQELWKELKFLTTKYSVSWYWVKGHAGDELNELCDSLVRSEIERLTRT